MVLFFIICMGNRYVHLSVGASKGQNKTLGPLELELLVAVSCPTWVVGIKLRSSGRASRVRPESLDSKCLGLSTMPGATTRLHLRLFQQSQHVLSREEKPVSSRHSWLVAIAADDHWPTENWCRYTSYLWSRGRKQCVKRGRYVKLSSCAAPH